MKRHIFVPKACSIEPRIVSNSGFARGPRGWGIILSAIISLVPFGGIDTAAIAQEQKVDQSRWMVGLARCDVTPQGPIWLAGYAARNKPSEGVLAPLEAKALCLQDAEGNRGLLLTMDLIGLRKAVAEKLCTQITEKTALRREQILLNYSHTHTGPVLALTAPTGYSMPPEAQETVVRYTEDLLVKLTDLAVRATQDLKPAQLAWGNGVASFAMNRREFTDRGVRIGVNPRGYVDRCVPVLRVTGENGQLLAVVFGYACHPTTLTGHHYEISGDYAGFAQANLEAEFPDLQAMFMIGCAADVNPHPRGETPHAKEHGQTLAAAVKEVLSGSLQPVRGPLKTALDWTEIPLQGGYSREQLEAMAKGPDYVAGNARRMLELLDRGETLAKSYQAPLAVWQFGDDLTLVALPGEVTSDYVPMIDTALGHLRLWIAAYCNEVFGYLPSAKVLKEGGYETRGIIPEPGFFAFEAEKVVVDQIRQMAQRLGRKIPEAP